MIRNDWLDHAAIPDATYSLDSRRAWSPKKPRAVYESLVSSALPFDLVMLGMGEDGHTASLFPGHEHDQSRLVVPVDQSPKPPPERVSLNFSALAQTRELLVLVTGEGKRSAVQAWHNNADLPVAALRCDAGIDVLLDDKAAGKQSLDQGAGERRRFSIRNTRTLFTQATSSRAMVRVCGATMPIRAWLPLTRVNVSWIGPFSNSTETGVSGASSSDGKINTDSPTRLVNTNMITS